MVDSRPKLQENPTAEEYYQYCIQLEQYELGVQQRAHDVSAKKRATAATRLKRHLGHKDSARHRRKANQILNDYPALVSTFSTDCTVDSGGVC